jgi:hypothetical protein
LIGDGFQASAPVQEENYATFAKGQNFQVFKPALMVLGNGLRKGGVMGGLKASAFGDVWAEKPGIARLVKNEP